MPTGLAEQARINPSDSLKTPANGEASMPDMLQAQLFDRAGEKTELFLNFCADTIKCSPRLKMTHECRNIVQKTSFAMDFASRSHPHGSPETDSRSPDRFRAAWPYAALEKFCLPILNKHSTLIVFGHFANTGRP
ncbi:hypothetical protein LJR030_005570 [Rhizobium sp. LjRoot30]|uniref:hypothetical protein n=1 Tax=Rhizobium sp. LjRoot30 TaxID=3342320 RepID=UPI003ED11E63